HFQQVPVRIFEVKAAAAAPVVDVAVVVAVGAAAVGDSFCVHPGEDGIELGIADMESVVVALASPWVVAAIAPALGCVGESQSQAVVDLNPGEEAAADPQSEDFCEKLGGSKLIFCRYDSVVQTNSHASVIIAPG